MRVRILTASLAVVVGCGALGCKSAPKMAWWSSSKDATKVEATAVAHAAPQLPSEIAKQAEGMNTANPVQITSAPEFTPGTVDSSAAGTAPPYVATTGAYPSTGAKSYVPTSSATASAGALPYNPNAVPAAKSAPNTQSFADSAATPTAPADRYGNLNSQNTESVAATIPASSGSAPIFSEPANTVANTPASSGSSGLGDRYSIPGTLATTPSAKSPASEPQQVQTTSAIASAEPYRPGGTGTYPAIAASNARYEIATRPATPATSESSVPNAAYPSTGGNQYR